MIQVQIAPTETGGPAQDLWLYARAPMVLPIRPDQDGIGVAPGQFLALNSQAFDESPELLGAVVMAISLGAMVVVRDGMLH